MPFLFANLYAKLWKLLRKFHCDSDCWSSTKELCIHVVWFVVSMALLTLFFDHVYRVLVYLQNLDFYIVLESPFRLNLETCFAFGFRVVQARTLCFLCPPSNVIKIYQICLFMFFFFFLLWD